MPTGIADKRSWRIGLQKVTLCSEYQNEMRGTAARNILGQHFCEAV